MNARNEAKLYPELLMALLAIVVLAVPSVYAQEEPTPVPEPAQEEPTPVPEPAAQAEPAAAAEPAQPVAAAEPAAAEAEAAPAEPAQEAEPAVAAVPVLFRHKTLVKIDGKAQAKGALELIVQPQGGDATKVRVNVLAKAKPKSITNDLLKELDFALDDRYQVNRSGDKKIVVKTKKKNPPIAITVTTQSLSGVSVTVGNG